MAEAQPFFEIYVRNNPHGGSIIFWGLKRNFNDPGTYTYIIEWAETVTGEYSLVNTGLLTDTLFAFDPDNRMCGKELESYYRITLTTECGTYVSFPQQASGVWNKREWLIGREVSRKEFLRMEKQVGIKGFLFKRKIAGPRCTVCVDPDTDEVTNSKCDTCFGTSIEGGYWPGFDTYVDTDTYGREKQHTDTEGVVEKIRTNVRMLGYPHVSKYDFFVDISTGERWVIWKPENAAELRGQPLIYNVEFRLAPFTDIIYDVPIPDIDDPLTSISVSSSSVSVSSSSVSSSSSSSSTVPIAPECGSSSSISSSSSSSVSVSSSSVSSSSSSTSMVPIPPPVSGTNWIWYDDAAEQWVISDDIGTGTIWYASDVPRPAAHQLIPFMVWSPVNAAGPAPSFVVAGSTVTVTAAGDSGVDGTYEFRGTVNNAYVFEQD